MLDCEGSSRQLPDFDRDLEKVTRGLNLSLVAPHLGDLDYPWNCASKVCDGHETKKAAALTGRIASEHLIGARG